METLESYNFKDKNKNNQLIFTILNYIFESTYTILKTKWCVHDNKLFIIIIIIIIIIIVVVVKNVVQVQP